MDGGWKSTVFCSGKLLVLRKKPAIALVNSGGIKFLHWLPGTDSNRRPTRYTLPVHFCIEWTISSSFCRREGANVRLLLGLTH